MWIFFIGPVKVSQRWFVISGSDRAHESTWEMKNKSENSGEGKLSRRAEIEWEGVGQGILVRMRLRDKG